MDKQHIITALDDRIETGVLQFNDDWPGIFIRGDNSLIGYAPALRHILDCVDEDKLENLFAKGTVESLAELLESCAV